MRMNYGDWPLHDAVLTNVVVDWASKTCEMHVVAFLDPGKPAVPCVLIWSRLRRVDIPLADPWGPSLFINSHRFEPDGVFTIEMQSGDSIVLEAGAVRFERRPT
jgi:hypothetical protein